MIELRTLGTLDLARADGPPLRSILAQEKRVALLVYLAVARPRGRHARDALGGLFWPDRDDARTRKALNQALYVLRRGLEHGVLATAEDGTVGVDPGRFRCDAVAFERALEAGRPREALDLYGGDFLGGFHLSGCPRFERWADRERARLRRSAVEAARRLAEERVEAGDAASAIPALERAAGWAPGDEDLHRLRLRLLVRTGARAEALRRHERFVARLRKELDRAPEAETTALVARIRTEGRVGPDSRPEGPTTAERPRGVGDAPDGVDGKRPATAPPAGAEADRPEAGSPQAGRPVPSTMLPRPGRSRGAQIGTVALLVALLALAVAALVRRAGLPEPGRPTAAAGPRTAAGAPLRVAVLPFSVRGGPELAYLREGMAELLATGLDGAGSLHSVDPRAVLSFLGRRGRTGSGAARDGVDGEGTATPRDGLAISRRFGADLFVLGSVLEAGGRLEVHAALYDSAGRSLAEVATPSGSEEEVFRLADDLTRRLIASRYEGEGGRLTRLAAATTPSVPALKSYLAGERALRDGLFDRALEAFRRSVARDSAFGLAWYRLAVAAEWTIRPELVRLASARAVEHASDLPEHDRLLVSAWHAYATGDAAEAERLYRRVLASHPDHVEAWLQLGEVLFHYGPLRGRPTLDAREAFRRVRALEPTHEGALLHLARLAARQAATARLDSLVDRLVSANRESELAVEVRTLQAFASGGPAARREVLEELRALDDAAVFTALWTVSYSRDPGAVARVAEVLADPSRAPEVRAAGRRLSAIAELARGRRGAAREALSAGARPVAARRRPDSAWALELEAFAAAAPFLVTPASERDRLRAALRSWDAAATPPALGTGAFLTAHDGIHGPLRTYLSGLLDLRAGHAEAARRAASILEAGSPQGTELPHADGDVDGTTSGEPARGPIGETPGRDLARVLRAEVLAAEGRQEAALELLADPARFSPYELAAASPFHAGTARRFLRAVLLEEAGRPEAALAAYASLGDGSVYDLPYVAPAQLRSARILERLGEPDRAAGHYVRFIALWENADPELRPRVEEAREALARIEGSR